MELSAPGSKKDMNEYATYNMFTFSCITSETMCLAWLGMLIQNFILCPLAKFVIRNIRLVPEKPYMCTLTHS
jgi:hypothetical protein